MFQNSQRREDFGKKLKSEKRYQSKKAGLTESQS